MTIVLKDGKHKYEILLKLKKMFRKLDIRYLILFFHFHIDVKNGFYLDVI